MSTNSKQNQLHSTQSAKRVETFPRISALDSNSEFPLSSVISVANIGFPLAAHAAAVLHERKDIGEAENIGDQEDDKDD